MKKMKIYFSAFGLFVSFLNAEELSEAKVEKISSVSLQKKLDAIDEGGNSKGIISLMKYHVDTELLVTIENKVPAIGYIIKNYDENIIPLLVEYALSVDNQYLKRRAVYCIERLYGEDIQSYVNEVVGEDVRPEGFETLIKASADNILKEIETLKKEGKNVEQGMLYVEYTRLFFPPFSEAIMNLKLP